MAQFCILITAVVTQTPTHVIKLHWAWYTHRHTPTQMNVCKARESWMKFYGLSQFSFLVLPVSCGYIRCNHDEAKWWVSETSPFAFNFPWTYNYQIFFLKYMLVLFKKRYFPGGPVAKILCSHSRGPGFDPWSGNYTLHATGKCLHTPNLKSSIPQLKDSSFCNEDRACSMQQLRPGTAK